MCAHRESSRWEVLLGKCVSRIVQSYISTSSVFVDSQSSSQSSGRSPSNPESVDLAVIGSSSKRKAALSPAGSQQSQKFARTDTSRHPGRSMRETEATSRTHDAFESRSTTTSPTFPRRKRRKVLLPRNRETLHPFVVPLTGTFTIPSLNSCRQMPVSSQCEAKR